MNPRIWKEDVNGNFDESFYFSKGGSAPMPPQPTPAEEAAAQILVNQDADRRAAEQRRIEARDLRHETNKKTGVFQSAVAGEQQRARDYARQQMGQAGLDNDPYGIMSLFEQELGNETALIPNLSENVNINDGAVWNRVTDNVKNTQRNKLNKAMDAFAGNGFENTMIGDSFDDAILESILGEQATDAQADIDRAKARGTLNDNSYAYATKAFGGQKAAANAKLQGLGGGVLAGYRTGLTNKAKGYRDNIQNWDLGDNIDLSAAQLGLGDLVKGYGTSLEGDLRNTIGDMSLFDIDLLLGKAATRAGAQNTGNSTNPLVAAFTEEDPNKRVLGNTGAF